MARVREFQEAENKFSEVVEEAVKYGPQIITKEGGKTVVVLSYDEYYKMTLSQKKLSEFFHESPLAEVNFDLTRDKSEIR
jgi:prevent-host-death family protein